MTKSEVLKILILIEAVFPYWIVKSETVHAWFKYCNVMDYKEVKTFLYVYLKENTYPPVFSTIIAQYLSHIEIASLYAEIKHHTWQDEYMLKQS